MVIIITDIKQRIERLKELIILARNGDKNAFSLFKKEIKNTVYGRFSSWWVQKNDLSDLFEATWLKVEMEIARYNPEIDNPIIFVLSIADKEARELFPKKNKKVGYIEDSKQEMSSNSEDYDPTGQSLLRKELGREINLFYIHVLKLIFTKGGYPHKIIAYMFCKIIFPCSEGENVFRNSSRKKEERVSGYPGKVVAEIFDKFLSELSVELEKSYHDYSGFPKKQIVPIFEYLHNEMILPVGDIVVRKIDSYTWSIIDQKGLLGQPVGKTVMRQYCEDKSPDIRLTALVSDWCNKIQVKVRSSFFTDPNWRTYFKVLLEVYDLRVRNPKLFYQYIDIFMNNPMNRR